MQRRSKRYGKNPCMICRDDAGDSSIECDLCKRWLHATCVPGLSQDDFCFLGENNFPFYCPACVLIKGKYDCGAALKRLVWLFYFISNIFIKYTSMRFLVKLYVNKIICVAVLTL